MFSKHCHVLLSCPLCPVQDTYSGRLVQSNLPRRSCLSCPVLDVLSKMSCPNPFCHVSAAMSQPHLSRASFPVQAVLFRCPAHATLSTTLLMPLSCPGNPVVSVLSRITYLSWPVSHPFTDCPVPIVLSRLSCLYCHSCSSRLSCLICHVWY